MNNKKLSIAIGSIKISKVSSILYHKIFQHFCYKYIPIKKLKFGEINFYEPVSKIYETDSSNNLKKLDKIFKVTSVTFFLNFLYNPFNLSQIISLIGNIILQPIFLKKILHIRKMLTSQVEKIYLLKNGQQVLIITQDNCMHFVNILDFNEIKEIDMMHQLRMTTFDKEFLLNLNEIKVYNEDIFNAIKKGRIINTRTSYDNYDRLTLQKLEPEYKSRLHQKKIKYEFDKISIRKYLTSYNRFLLIKHKLGNEFMKYYYKYEDKQKTNNSMEIVKRKLNIHMYTSEKFFKTFGIELNRFLGKINSVKNKEEYDSLLQQIRMCESITSGRKVKNTTKKLL